MLSTEDQLLIGCIKERAKDPTRATLMADRYNRPAKPFPPATLEQIEAAEAQIGFRLPELIREIYLQVGNGGFGPGYGIGGVEDGMEIYECSLVQNVIECREADDFFAETAENEAEKLIWAWDDQYIMYCYWGCNVTTLVDCADPSLPVISLDSFWCERQRQGKHSGVSHSTLPMDYEQAKARPIWSRLWAKIPQPTQRAKPVSP